MPSVAEQLRQAREQQSLTVYDVADATKIKTDHVRALEEGNFQAFSAPIYIRGFVRSYANLLKLDTPKILQELDDELQQIKKFREPPSLTGEGRGWLDQVMLFFSKVSWKVGLPVIGVVLFILLAGFVIRTWNRHRNADPLINLGPGIYRPADTNAGELLPLPKSP